MTDSKTLDLPDNEKRIVLEILSKIVPGRPVYAFGSRATGKARRRSDLDLAIGGETRLTLRQRATLSDDFSESDLPIFVDVVDLATVSDSFLQRIQRHWIPLTGEQENTVPAYTAVAVAA